MAKGMKIMKEKFDNKMILKNKKSVMYSWGYSYLYITLIFIFVLIIISLIASAMYRNQMNNADANLTEHTQSVMDGVFGSLKRSSSSIWLDSDIVSVFKIGDNISDEQYANINEIMKKISRVKVSNENISDICLVDAIHNRVYLSGGVVDIPTYYNIAFSNNNEDYYDFLDVLNRQKSEEYIVSAPDGEVQKIFYIRGFGYSGHDNLNQSIIITANAKTFVDQMKSIKNMGVGSEVFIMGEDGRLMVSTGSDVYKSIDASSLSGDNGSFTVKHGRKKYVLWYEKSNQGNWYYIVSHPKSQNYLRTLLFQLIFSLGFIIVLIFSGFYFRRFIKKNYGPLLVILNMIGKKDDADAPQNEFDMIAESIENMLAVNKNLDKRIYDQNRILRDAFLEKLCLGHMDGDSGVLSDNLYIYDINFTGKKFLSLVIFLGEDTEAVNDSEIYSFKQTAFIIANVMEELINERHYGILFECSDAISGIVNINDTHADTIKEDMKNAVSRAQSFILENFGIRFTVAFSSVFENIENADKGYNEAVDTMRYKSIMGIDETLFGDDVNNTNKAGYYYPFDIEHQLRNLILSGNAEEAKALIESVFDENIKNKQLAPDLFQYLMFNITSTVVRTMNEMPSSDGEDILKDTDLVNKTMQGDSMHKRKDALFDLIDKITSMSVKSAGVKNNWIVSGVIPYIEENYTDCNLSVAMIAEHFGMHPVYTSRLFKEQTGVGLFEYISKLRIDKSKEILVNTDYTLENVAEQVGYATSRTFARMFKKTEGITPGKYRELHYKQGNI